MISFFANGLPKGQPRVKAWARKTAAGPVARVYDPGTADGWKSIIAAAAQPYRPPVPLLGPVILTLGFRFPRPKRLLRRHDPLGEIPHTAKPDADNLAKAVLDVLTQIGFWRDDAVVTTLVVSKTYVRKDSGAAGVDVEIVGPELEQAAARAGGAA